MSLVAYGSSDDSDSEETPSSGPESRSLFSSLPAPKHPGSGKGIKAKEVLAKDDRDPEQYKAGLFSSLPKPKKRTEPVKITIPEIEKRDVSIRACGVYVDAHGTITLFLVYSQILMMMNQQRRKQPLG